MAESEKKARLSGESPRAEPAPALPTVAPLEVAEPPKPGIHSSVYVVYGKHYQAFRMQITDFI